MKFGFTSKGTGWDASIDPRFGRARFLLVYDESTDVLTAVDNSANSKQSHGAGPGTAKKIFELETDILITGNGPGENAAAILQKAGIIVYAGAKDMTIREAYDHYIKNELKQFNLKR
jgi:predicted Fe-Mo cluster-binding NifX family protein